MSKVKLYLALMRPANIITAIADIWAGVAIAGLFQMNSPEKLIPSFILLTISTVGLYGGGIVFNDFFDVKIDRKERPERPLPSGKVSLKEAFLLGFILLTIGIFAAFMSNIWSGLIALFVACAALFYDKYAKHHSFFGHLVMGTCRMGNLWLGISILPDVLLPNAYMGILPLLFIAAITLTSQGEVLGNNKLSIALASFLDIGVGVILISLGIFGKINLFALLPFVLYWWWLNLNAKWKAITENLPKNIMNAVKTGVISLIILDASYAASFGVWWWGLTIFALLPLSKWLGKQFAVT